MFEGAVRGALFVYRRSVLNCFSKRAASSSGRASAWHAGGDRFKSGAVHQSTPLNRSGGFVGDAVDHRTHFAHFIGDAAGDLFEEIIGELGEAGGEAVDAPDCPECHHVA